MKMKLIFAIFSAFCLFFISNIHAYPEEKQATIAKEENEVITRIKKV